VMTRTPRKGIPDDTLAAYRRVRKAVPPPEKVLPDKRRKLRERAERKERRQDEP
jgi:hypothetical protein